MQALFRYFIFSLCMLCGVFATAQHNYRFRNVKMSDGLSGLLVNTIYKDKTGFVWIGTDNCLNRFDGVVVTQYDFREQNLGQKRRINAIAETLEGDLWIGNGVGMWRLNRETEHLERIMNQTIDCGVNAILTDSVAVYVATDRGLFICKANSSQQILLDNTIFSPCNRITDICLDSDKSTLWLTTIQGLYSYSSADNKISAWHFREKVPDADYFRCITRIGNTLYIGTMSQGLLSFDISTCKFSRIAALGYDVISDISSDGTDLIYVATDGNGVHFLSHKSQKIERSLYHNVKDKEGISSNSIYSLLAEDNGAVWIGHFQSGLDYTLNQNGLFTTYAFPPHFTSANLSVRSFVIRGTEKIIGSRDGLFYIDETKGRMKILTKPTLKSDLILAICFYQGDYYIGTYGGGMISFNPETLTTEQFTKGDATLFQHGHVFCIKSDDKQNLWIGTSQGVYCYNKPDDTIKSFNSKNSQLPEGNVYEITFDCAGKGWIATETGMGIYDPVSQSIRSNIFPEGFIHRDKVRTVYEDSQHKLYFIREKGPLFLSSLKMDAFSDFDVNNLMPDNSLMSIVEDNLGWLWLGSDNGLMRVNKQGTKYDAFTYNDGLPGHTFTNGAAYRDENGLLWFGNTNGLVSVDPARVDEIKHRMGKVSFTKIVANGSDVKSPSLKHFQNNITFNFTDFSYGLPSAMLYEYCMEGVSEEWKLLVAHSEVSYYGLPPGRYQFHVRLPGNELSVATYRFYIKPIIPWWVYVSLVVAVAGIFWYVVQRVGFKRLIVMAKRSLRGERKRLYRHDDTNKYKTTRMTQAECTELYKKLVAYVEQSRAFKNPELKMGDIASDIDMTPQSLSYLLNQFLHTSYYDFINEYRIEEFKRLAADRQYSQYTLSALAELCGFSSRASFFRSFKKSTGITPNEYINRLGGKN